MKDDDLIKRLNKTNRLISSYMYGIDPKFVDKNRRIIDETETMVKNYILRPSKSLNGDIRTSVNAIKRLMSNNMSNKAIDEVDKQFRKQMVSKNGSRFISPSNQVPLENQVIDLYSGMMRNVHLLAIEYRNIAKLIPEVNECAGLIADTVINKNGFDGSFIRNVYKPKIVERTNEITDEINDRITEFVVEKYGLEEKIESYIKTSMIEGAKPVAIYSYDEIIETMQIALNDTKKTTTQNYNDGKYDMTREQKREKLSSESIENFLYNHRNDKNLLPDTNLDIFSTRGEEDFNDDNIYGIESIVGNKLLDDFFTASVEDAKDVVKRTYHDRIASLKVSDLTETDLEGAVEKENGLYNDIMGKIEKASKDKAMDFLKKEVYDIVSHIDDNIKIYKGDYAGVNLAKDQVYKRLAMNNMTDTDRQSVIINNAETRYGIGHDYSNDIIFDENANRLKDTELNEHGGLKGRKKDGYDAREDVSMWKKNSLIIPLDIENVIPVIINGQHIGYYVFEESAYTGSTDSSKKRHSSFTELFKQLGFSNDDAMTNYSSYGGFNNLGGTDQLNTMAGNALASGSWSYNMSGGNFSDLFNSQNLENMMEPVRRNEVLKQIVLKTVSKKLTGTDMTNDKKFKDAIMSLLRDGLIVNKQVVVTFIPESNMCYFSPRLDSDGLPESLLKDCLWICYLYISSLLGSAMIKLFKSGTRDKISFEVGEAKDIQSQIRWLEKSLTSRHLNVESIYTSLPRVLKAASTTDTIYEPKFDGESLYQYEDITRTNDISPDDSYTTDLLNRIIRSMGAPTTVVNVLNEEEFATTAISKNIVFEKRVNSYKSSFNRTVTKMLRIIAKNDYVNREVIDDSKSKDMFEIDEIDFRFTKSQDLNIQNTENLLSSAKTHVETMTDMFYSNISDSNISARSKELFKMNIMKELVQNFDYDYYSEIKKRCDIDAVNDVQSFNVDRQISERIDTTEIGAANTEEDNVEDDSDDNDSSKWS